MLIKTQSETIENTIIANSDLRKRVVQELEQTLNYQLDYEDESDYNIYFTDDLEEKILRCFRVFHRSDKIVMNRIASKESLYTKEGSRGTILEVGDDTIYVHFTVFTGDNAPAPPQTWRVKSEYAEKAQYWDLISKHGGSSKKAAQQIIAKALTKVYSEYVRDSKEEITFLAKKLAEAGHVSLINDEGFIEHLKEKAFLFEYPEYPIMKGNRKYIVNTAYSSTSPEQAQMKAEENAIDDAKKIGANYLLIKRKDLFQSGEYNISTVVLESIPLIIIGDTEIGQIARLNKIDEQTQGIIKRLALEEKINNTYWGMARFSPENFLDCLENGDKDKQREMIISIIPLISEGLLSEELAKTLRSGYAPLLKEVFAGDFRDKLLEEQKEKKQK